MISRITIMEKRKPVEPDVNADIDWLCKSLGFVSPRDFEQTSAKIFHALVSAATKKEGLSSDELAEQSGVTRGAVVHHLKSYMDSGVVVYEKRRYILRTRSVEKTLAEVKRDILRMFDDIQEIAKEVDERLGLKER